MLHNSNTELMDNFREFAVGALLVAQETVDSAILKEIIHVCYAPSGRVHMEVCVTFETVEERDFYNSRARNLASYKDFTGRPEAGVRMDFPPFLLSSFKILNDHAYEIRDLHGKETKRYIKFHDEKLSLILEVCLLASQKWI